MYIKQNIKGQKLSKFWLGSLEYTQFSKVALPLTQGINGEHGHFVEIWTPVYNKYQEMYIAHLSIVAHRL